MRSHRVQEAWRWWNPERISLLVVFCILILHPVSNGYPFVFPDSWGYASGHCPVPIRSAVLGCAMRPVVLLAGTWGYVVVQCAVTACALVFLWSRVLERSSAFPLYVATVLAGVGLHAGYLMADIWTLIGFICIFSVSVGAANWFVYALLSFAFSVHFGNFPIFSATALMFLPFVKARKSFAATVSLCFAAGGLLVLLANASGGDLRLAPKTGGFVFLSSRVLHDVPEVIVQKCHEDPSFKFCGFRNSFSKKSGEDANPQRFTWNGARELKISEEEFERLSREIVLYSLDRFLLENLAAMARNTYQLVTTYELADGFSARMHEGPFQRRLQRLFPNDLDDYLESWQTGGQLERALKAVEMPLTTLLRISILICLGYVGLNWKDRDSDLLVKLSAFALIAVLLNAFIASTVSGPFGRFQTRVGFLLIYPATLLAFRTAKRFASQRIRTWS